MVFMSGFECVEIKALSYISHLVLLLLKPGIVSAPGLEDASLEARGKLLLAVIGAFELRDGDALPTDIVTHCLAA